MNHSQNSQTCKPGRLSSTLTSATTTINNPVGKKQRPASASCIGKRDSSNSSGLIGHSHHGATQKARPQSSHSRSRKLTPMKEGPVTCTQYETGSEVREEIKEKSRLNIRNQRLSERYFLTSMQLLGKINGGSEVHNKERRLALERLKFMEDLHLKSIENNDLNLCKSETTKSKYSKVPSRVFQSPSRMERNISRREQQDQPNVKDSPNEVTNEPKKNHPSTLISSKKNQMETSLENTATVSKNGTLDSDKNESKRRVLRGKSNSRIETTVSREKENSTIKEENPSQSNSEISDLASSVVPSHSPKEEFKKVIHYSSHIGTTRIEGKHNNQLNGPYDVKIHPTQNLIIISDSKNSRIQFFDLQSHDFQFCITTPATPHCVALGLFDNSVVVSCQNDCIYKYSLETRKQVWRAGGHGTAPSQFHFPLGVVVDEHDSNKVYVCDSRNHRVQCLSSNGQYLTEFSLSPTFSPFSVDISKEGHLIVMDNRNSCLYVLQKDGTLLRSIEHSFLQPLCVSVDRKSGRVFVCDSNNLRIVVLDSECIQIIETIGSYSSYMLHPAKPLGISVYGQILVVADYENHRVLQAFLE
ncbi:hypothetical protein FDP41_003348 [Naegleria fowleri]|uniref:SMP-30/Gluconolactonase/LRE-like region domain-containing protein n=1 Tax=Naegleria fowleri TaxID=5763 RepID=A0A6A5BQK8_NAEFO|nr:uncharacterized protein FDP41_003348 [Naegleria fowleri]KAF0977356.1 hypothetical protein FDP41_003348 [Naegleria fowleri]CAG4713588.1 unnamed protein product [Naegleria fowleri]